MSKTIEIFEDRITIQGDDTYQCSEYLIEGATDLITGDIIFENGLTTVDVENETYINAEVEREDFLKITLSSTPFEKHITIPYRVWLTFSERLSECGVPNTPGGGNAYKYMPEIDVHTVYKDGEMSIESISTQGMTFTPDE